MDTFIALLTSSAGLATALLPVVYYGALLSAFVFAFLALKKVKDMGKEGGSGPVPTWGAVIGDTVVVLIGSSLASWVNNISQSYGGIASGISEQMAYMQANTASSLQPMWTAIKAWLLLMGVVAVWRAALLIARAASGTQRDGDSWWAAFWFFLGGAALVNIATY